jgi:hypothetical protein
MRMVESLDEVDDVSFRRTDSPSIVAKIAPHHDIFRTTNDLIVNAFQEPDADLRLSPGTGANPPKYFPTINGAKVCRMG